MSKSTTTTRPTDVMGKALAHFKALGVKKIEVKEWNTTIYSKPMTMAEKKVLLDMVQNSNDDTDILIRTLIFKAEDELGNKLFDVSDKKNLSNNVSSDVIIKIVDEMVLDITIKKQEEK